MEVDSEEVKRHLDILGYTQIEPSLLNDFIEDLKRLIEYDRKHNVSQLSTSLHKDWDQSYSQRMKNSTPNKNAFHRNCTANGDEHEDDVNLLTITYVKNSTNRSTSVVGIVKRKNQNCTSQSISKTIDLHNTIPVNKKSKCESEFMPKKCYFCGSIQMENQPRMKMKQNLNVLHTLHLGITFDIEF